MHLHGHKFWVLGVGPCSQAGEIAANRSAVKKDTLPVPGKACAVLRVTFDNPGPWMFHCHNELHLARGMGGIFVVDHLITAPDGLFSNLSIAEDDINAFCEEQGSAARKSSLVGLPAIIIACAIAFFSVASLLVCVFVSPARPPAFLRRPEIEFQRIIEDEIEDED